MKAVVAYSSHQVFLFHLVLKVILITKGTIHFFMKYGLMAAKLCNFLNMTYNVHHYKKISRLRNDQIM